MPPVLPSGLRLPASLTRLDLSEIIVPPFAIAAGHSLKLLQVRVPNLESEDSEDEDDSGSDDSERPDVTARMIAELETSDVLKNVVITRYGGSPADHGKDEDVAYGY